MVLFNPLRKLVMVSVVVILQNYPVWQIISLLILSFIKLLILTVYQPLKKRGQNILQVVAELCFFLGHVLLLFFPIFE